MRVKQLRFILGFLVLSVSFQNCGGSGGNATNTNSGTAAGTSVQGSKTPTSSSSGSKGLSSGSAKDISKSPSGGATFGGISAGSAGSMGGSSGGSTGGSSGTCLGCGTGSGGTGGTGTGTGTGTGNGNPGSGEIAFKITKQPISKTVDEGYDFTVGVSVQGGKGPYKFNWFRDSAEIPPKYGTDHYESYSDMLDRIYKQGDYYVIVTDATGAKLTSTKAQIRMTGKACRGGNYFIDLSKRTNPSDGYYYFNDLFYYKNTKYLVSQYNPTVAQMQLNNFVRYLNTIGFGYFTINQDISNNQAFVLECSTDVPTIHTSECATNNLSKCYYSGDNGYTASSTYQGGINFVCRDGFIEFVSNTCSLVAPPPAPDPGNNGGGG